MSNVLDIVKFLKVIDYELVSQPKHSHNFGMIEDETIDELQNYPEMIKNLYNFFQIKTNDNHLTEQLRQQLVTCLHEFTQHELPKLEFIELECTGKGEDSDYVLIRTGNLLTYGDLLMKLRKFKHHSDFSNLCDLTTSDQYPNRITFDVTHG